MYKWGTDLRYTVDLPGFVEAKDPNDLPKDTQFTDEAKLSLFKVGFTNFANLGLSNLFEVWDSWDSLDDFRQLITPVIKSGLPPAANYWRDDAWFGGTFLNGSNPEVIQMCKSLPNNFPVKNEMVDQLLDRGYDLNKAMKVTTILKYFLFVIFLCLKLPCINYFILCHIIVKPNNNMFSFTECNKL